jgi:hypothetical protein
VQSTAVPQAIASTTGKPNPSYKDGKTKQQRRPIQCRQVRIGDWSQKMNAVNSIRRRFGLYRAVPVVPSPGNDQIRKLQMIFSQLLPDPHQLLQVFVRFVDAHIQQISLRQRIRFAKIG